MKNTWILILLLFALHGRINSQVMADFQTVPLPQSCEPDRGKPLALADVHAICYADESLKRNALFLSEYIQQNTGKEMETIATSSRKTKGINVTLALTTKILQPEGYQIKITPKGILIQGSTPAGVFYGVQTLRKALPVITADSIDIPACTVTDAPRFPYRGMHLDVARHFFDIHFVKQYIDMMALHHINRFHFHITDDQGWRWQVNRYPNLTHIGAYRNRTVIGRNTGLYNYDRYGGFFTQDELKEIVDYARERYITVIPEIDMPGHMEAALAAYPELGCTGGPYEVEPNWGVFDDILCAGNEKTFEFIEGVLDELIEIFPSEYIHIGGDEAPRTRWRVCPKCQERIRQIGLAGDEKHSAEDYLQGYFMKRVEAYLNGKGRKVIGWDELLDCKVNTSTTIMSWRGAEGGIRASQLGHDVIMVPTSTSYFDYYQTPEDDYWSKPLLIGGFVPLEKVYLSEPAPDSLSVDAQRHIIGVQANLWTEYITDQELAEYQVLPRMGALAEIQWGDGKTKNFEEFLDREWRLMKIYALQGWKYCTYLPKKYRNP